MNKILLGLIMISLSYSNTLKADNSDPYKPAPIIRKAKAIIQVNKIWYEKNEKGQYEHKTEVFCERTLPNIDVFEMAAGYEYTPKPNENMATCETPFKDSKIVVTVTPLVGEGVVGFGNIIKAGTRIKLFYSFVSAYDQGVSGTTLQPTMSNSFWTEDLKLKTMMSYSFPMDQQRPAENVCDSTKCVDTPTKAPPFYFEAYVRIEDDNA
jgi:hypothetical protein